MPSVSARPCSPSVARTVRKPSTSMSTTSTVMNGRRRRTCARISRTASKPSWGTVRVVHRTATRKTLARIRPSLPEQSGFRPHDHQPGTSDDRDGRQLGDPMSRCTGNRPRLAGLALADAFATSSHGDRTGTRPSDRLILRSAMGRRTSESGRVANSGGRCFGPDPRNRRFGADSGDCPPFRGGNGPGVRPAVPRGRAAAGLRQRRRQLPGHGDPPSSRAGRRRGGDRSGGGWPGRPQACAAPPTP